MTFPGSKIRGDRTWTIAIRPFYANQSSELNFPIFSREKWPQFGRKRDFFEPLLTAMAQVLTLLNKVTFGVNFRATLGETPEVTF